MNPAPSCTDLCTHWDLLGCRVVVSFTAVVTSGAVAQLGEHLLCKQGVAGSIPVRSIRVRQKPRYPRGRRSTG